MKRSQGRQVNESEHELLLEKMKQFQQGKTVCYLKENPTYDNVMRELNHNDEVLIQLQDKTVLRVKPNQVWINGILAESVNPTSDETGATYEQGIRKSNNYTGVQHFKQILEKYLD